MKEFIFAAIMCIYLMAATKILSEKSFPFSDICFGAGILFIILVYFMLIIIEIKPPKKEFQVFPQTSKELEDEE